MKRITLILMAMLLCFGMAACGTNENNGDNVTDVIDESAEVNDTTSADPGDTAAPDDGKAVGGVNPEASVVNNYISVDEYNNYYDFFFVSTGDEPLNKEYTKEGIFTTIYDNFNDEERYYIWGYGSDDLTCDYQWEFVPADPAALPAKGSHIKMTGTLVKSEDALDGYWYENAGFELVEEYKGETTALDLTTLNPTLTRVQILSMVHFPTGYNGKQIKIYGRINGEGELQHPYYDSVWSLPIDFEGDLPEEGSWVTLYGSYYGTYREDCKLIAQTINVE